MNLHEECLLKYLLKPSDLIKSTELLELNNSIIKNNLKTNIMTKKALNYTSNRA